MKNPVAAVAVLALAITVVPAGTAVSRAQAATVTLPSYSAAVSAAELAADYYRTTYAHTTVTPGNGWSWSTYTQGALALYEQGGSQQFLNDDMAWGQSNDWGISTEINPDQVKALQTYDDLAAIDPTASLTTADTAMASDLANLPVSQYYWADALFMGLPDWTRWATRTGNSAYLDKLDALYTWTRDQGGTSSVCAGKSVPDAGLFDATQSLWYRDCTFDGAVDSAGQPIFWSRGNGWVIAAMAQVLQTLPAGDPRAAKYATMLQTMAARLVALQGSDGLWRSSLLDAALYPSPETSGTALITYALAYGIKAGLLSSATYLPVVAKAWQGLTTISLRPSGFVTDCQGVGSAPGVSYTAASPQTAQSATSAGTVNADSPPFCVGAFLLAGAQVAQLVSNPPAAPTSFVAKPGDGQVSLSWVAPSIAGGDPITDYVVQYRIAGASSWTSVDLASTNTTATINSLTDNTSYNFTVSAVNGGGQGPPSATSSATPVAAPAQLLPDPGFESGNGGWIAFKVGTLVRVTSPIHGGSHALQVTSPSGSASLVGLTQNSVVTSSLAGRAYTASCYVRPTSGGLNVQIRWLEYTQNFGSVIDLQSNLTSALPAGVWTLVQVTSTAVNSGERMIPQIFSSNETSANGSLLYDDCSVTAAPGTAATAPPAPTSVVATAGDGNASVAFSAPSSNGGSAITSYRVLSSPGGLTGTGGTSPIIVSGLTDGTSYTFIVTATNGVGPGTASAPSNSVTPAHTITAQLLPDPGFESGNGGWVAFKVGTLTRVGSPVHGGAFALMVAATGSAATLVGLTQNSVVSNSVAGTTYTASCYVEPTSSNLNVQLRFLEYTQNFGSNTQLQTVVVNVLPINTWTLVQVSGVAAKSGERIIPQIYSSTQTTATGSLLYDDCSVTSHP